MKRTVRLAQQFVTAVGCANGNGGRHLGCEHAVKTLQSSKFLEQVRVPIRWNKIVEEVTTGRHFDALAGVTKQEVQEGQVKPAIDIHLVALDMRRTRFPRKKSDRE
ncbi:hypothetical protein RB195_025852 [Necator americanus]|uniref:Uncharacterized protein n=1 Tax=Necator americanus TaxID=51031 RepID=A0ABR1EUR8_NECAM